MENIETFNHNCIKCKKAYQDTDPDAYYCVECKKEKDRIAAEIDKKLANKQRRPTKSDLQHYNELAKRGAGGFPRASDIM